MGIQNQVGNLDIGSNNINDLPNEYRSLFSPNTYDLLVTGCLEKKKCGIIKTKRYVDELHKLVRIHNFHD